MILIGLILLIVGLLAPLHILFVLGLILLVLGLVFSFVPIGGRTRRWY